MDDTERSDEELRDRPTHGLTVMAHEPLPFETNQVVHGTPITPAAIISKLDPTSFCVSYWNRRPIEPYLSKLSPSGRLLLDNGAFSQWQHNLRSKKANKAICAITPEYWNGFYTWAMPILTRVPQAMLIIPDVIKGTVSENRDLILSVPPEVPLNRCIPVWHLDEPLSQLEWLVEEFGEIAFGSAGEFRHPGTLAWRQRIQQAMDLIEALCTDQTAGISRPRLHLLRGLGPMRDAEFPFTSADSTNLARNHHLLAKSGTTITQTQRRLESLRYPAPAGPIWPNSKLNQTTSPLAKSRPLQLPLFRTD